MSSSLLFLILPLLPSPSMSFTSCPAFVFSLSLSPLHPPHTHKVWHRRQFRLCFGERQAGGSDGSALWKGKITITFLISTFFPHPTLTTCTAPYAVCVEDDRVVPEDSNDDLFLGKGGGYEGLMLCNAGSKFRWMQWTCGGGQREPSPLGHVESQVWSRILCRRSLLGGRTSSL